MPEYVGQSKANSGSVTLQGEMMSCLLGWNEAAGLIIAAMDKQMSPKYAIYDFAQQMDDATEFKFLPFGNKLNEVM